MTRMEYASCGCGESWGSSRCCCSTWTPGCCFSPFQHIPEPPPQPLRAPQLPRASSELLQFPLWAPQGFHCQGDLMQIRLAGPALITALPSTGGSRECTSFSSRAWEIHGQIPQGQNLPLAQSQQVRDVPVPHQVRTALPARDAGSGEHRMSCTHIPKQLHGDAQLLCLALWPTSLWGLQKEAQRTTPFCKEAAFGGLRSVRLLGGFEGSAEIWKREAERYVHTTACIL